jgi:hypothetical protein
MQDIKISSEFPFIGHEHPDKKRIFTTLKLLNSLEEMGSKKSHRPTFFGDKVN